MTTNTANMATRRTTVWSTVSTLSVVAALSLTGCSGAGGSAPTVTVTVTAAHPTASASTMAIGDPTPIDATGICVAEGMIDTAQMTLLTSHPTPDARDAIERAVRLMYSDLNRKGIPDAAQQDITQILNTDPTRVDANNPTVMRVQQHIIDTCTANGLSIGAAADGG